MIPAAREAINTLVRVNLVGDDAGVVTVSGMTSIRHRV